MPPKRPPVTIDDGGYPGSIPAKPDNNLVWAIVSTLLCCLPLGIVSIIHATKVNDLYAARKYNEAQAEAKKAKQWAVYGVVAGIIFYIIYAILYSLGSLA